MSMLARGARSSQPRTRALYQPFRPLLVSWFGERELRMLSGIEESGSAHALVDLALPCGYYLNEILIRLLGKEQVQAPVFAHYALALAKLEQHPEKPEPVLREFELMLLDALGLLPDFANCAEGDTHIHADAQYVFFPGHSTAVLIENPQEHFAIPKKAAAPVMLMDDGETRDEGIKLNGSSLLALQEFDLSSDAVLRDIKPLMKRLLRLQLGDRPLRSRELFAAYTPPPPPPYAGGNE